MSVAKTKKRLDRTFLREMVRKASVKVGRAEKFLEKDFYIDHILSELKDHERLSKILVFKGWTCLSKGYLNYFRMSEDLDFSVRLEKSLFWTDYGELAEMSKSASRRLRSSIADELILEISKLPYSSGLSWLWMKEKSVEESSMSGTWMEALVKHNESKFVRFEFEYLSVISRKKESVLLEIAFSPYFYEPKEIVLKSVFRWTPLTFQSNDVRQVFSEKFAAMTNRSYRERRIAVRDFFDVRYLYPLVKNEIPEIVPTIAKICVNDFKAKNKPWMVGLFDVKHDFAFLKKWIFEQSEELIAPAGVLWKEFLTEASVDEAFARIYAPIQSMVKKALWIPDGERLNDGLHRIFPSDGPSE